MSYSKCVMVVMFFALTNNAFSSVSYACTYVFEIKNDLQNMHFAVNADPTADPTGNIPATFTSGWGAGNELEFGTIYKIKDDLHKYYAHDAITASGYQFQFTGTSGRIYLFPNDSCLPTSVLHTAPTTYNGDSFQLIEMTTPGVVDVSYLTGATFPVTVSSSAIADLNRACAFNKEVDQHTLIKELTALPVSRLCISPAGFKLPYRNRSQCIYSKCDVHDPSCDPCDRITNVCGLKPSDHFVGVIGPNKYNSNSPPANGEWNQTYPYPRLKSYLISLSDEDDWQWFAGAEGADDAGWWQAKGTSDGNIMLRRCSTEDPGTNDPPPNCTSAGNAYVKISDSGHFGAWLGGTTCVEAGSVGFQHAKVEAYPTGSATAQGWLSDIGWNSSPALRTGSTVVGNVTFALAYGMMGSTKWVENVPHVQVGNVTVHDVWVLCSNQETLTPPTPHAKRVRDLNSNETGKMKPAFAELQPKYVPETDDGQARYDVYAEVIHRLSGGRVYGYAYSDHYLGGLVAIPANKGDVVTISLPQPLNMASSFVYGDANGDGVVDDADRDAVDSASPICSHDVNVDGTTDMYDLLLLLEGWGTSCSP